jgi:hypothetical protein
MDWYIPLAGNFFKCQRLALNMFECQHTNTLRLLVINHYRHCQPQPIVTSTGATANANGGQ